jgi:hypothetical protein
LGGGGWTFYHFFFFTFMVTVAIMGGTSLAFLFFDCVDLDGFMAECPAVVVEAWSP